MREVRVDESPSVATVRPAPPKPPAGLLTGGRRALRRSRSTLVGGLIVLAIVLIAVFASLLSPYDP
jgi:hypothetical protein